MRYQDNEQSLNKFTTGARSSEMLTQHKYTHFLLKAATKEPPHPETDGPHLAETLKVLSKFTFLILLQGIYAQK